MKQTKKSGTSLKAFTLMEILVTMILSVIVITSAGMCYQLAIKQYEAYRQSNDKTLKKASFYSVLENDMENANKVIRQYKDINCINDSSKINYSFSTDFILRKVNTVCDTFSISAANILTSLDHESISQGLIDELSFETGKEQVQVLRFSKHYGSDMLIKTNSSNPRILR